MDPAGISEPAAPGVEAVDSGGADRRGVPEELAVCETCGLVSRAPAPPVCPMCGAGRG